jgi:hypothetical protein
MGWALPQWAWENLSANIFGTINKNLLFHDKAEGNSARSPVKRNAPDNAPAGFFVVSSLACPQNRFLYWTGL